MSASLTPRSAPFSPRPRNGSITPGESNEYTSGDSESLSRVDSARVSPGWADVRNALGVAGVACHQHTDARQQIHKTSLTSRYTNISKSIKQRRFTDVGHANDEHVYLWGMGIALGNAYQDSKY